MSAYRRGVIWIGTLAIIGTGLFPPWISVWGSTGGLRKPLGYRWLFAPPSEDGAVELDVSRLLIQWSMIALLAGVLFYAPPTRGWNASRLKRIGEAVATVGVLVGLGLVLVTEQMRSSHQLNPIWEMIGGLAWLGLLLGLVVVANREALKERIKDIPSRVGQFFSNERTRD